MTIQEAMNQIEYDVTYATDEAVLLVAAEARRLRAEKALWKQADLDTRIATGYKRDPRPMAECAMEMVEGYVRLEKALEEIATGPWGETEMRNIAREALKKGDSHEN